MSHPFLSDAWMEAARAIRAKYEDQAAEVTVAIRMNQVITDVPFGDGIVRAFTDTSTGRVVMELGELSNADVTVTTDYETALKILVEQDQAAAMQAFMAGRVKVQGDMMKMMAMQTAMPQDDIARAIAEEIRSITA
jgi:predicted lipid carrier protein YhbT